MSEQEYENPSEKEWEELRDRARHLMDSLEERDIASVSSLIADLNSARDNTIYTEVGRLTRGLHDAIRNFDIDTSSTENLSDESASSVSQMANAQDRLDYVINLTQKAADKTMDMVEEGIPVAAELGQSAEQIRSDWGRLLRREMQADEFRDLYQRIDQHLVSTVSNSDVLSQKFNEILMAQDFQDLTGQVIKKVISLVQEVEDRLVELMRVAGQVEELTGIITGDEAKPSKDIQGLDSAAEGPQVNAELREDVVSGQDDVDDLLSSLGF